MANTDSSIKYVDYTGLSYYDSKIKAYLATKDAEVLSKSNVTIEKAATPTSGSAVTYIVKQNKEITAYALKTDSSQTITVTAYDALSAEQKALYVAVESDREVGKIEIPLDRVVDGARIDQTKDTDGKVTKTELVLTIENTTDATTTSGKKEVKVDITSATSAVETRVAALETQVGKDKTVNAYQSKSDLVDVVNVLTADNTTDGSVAKVVKDAVEALDTTADVELASVADGVVTIKALRESDGMVAASTDTTLNVTLAKVATTGAAADVSIADAGSLITATTVEGALQEIATDVDTNADAISTLNGTVSEDGSVLKMVYDNAKDAKSGSQVVDHYALTSDPEQTITVEAYNALTDEQKALYTAVKRDQTLSEAIAAAQTASNVTVEKQTTAEDGYISTYVVKQNGAQVGEKINIPKDYLVKSADVKTCEEADKPVEGYKVGDKYIDFVINSADGSGNESHIYLLVQELVDAYTGKTVTNGVSVAVSDDNEISATISGKAIARENIDDDFEADLAALEGTHATDTEGNFKTVAAEIQADAENADYTPAKGDKTTIQAAIRALEAASEDTNGAFVYKGELAKSSDLPTSTAAKGDAYLVTATNTLYICTASADSTTSPVTAATFKQIAANGEFSVGNDTLAHSVSVKDYIDSRIFIGTQTEVDNAKAAGLIDDTTFVIVTDSDSQELKPITESEIDSLFA